MKLNGRKNVSRTCLSDIPGRPSPGRAVGIEPAFGHEHVQVAIEVQVAPEGMWDDQDHQPHAVGPASPLLDDLGPKTGESGEFCRRVGAAHKGETGSAS